MRIRTVWFILFVGLLSACMLNRPRPTMTPTMETPLTPQDTPETPTPSLEIAMADGALGPANFPPYINPLTGLVVDDPDVLNRRPMIVKISNAPPLVRPQAGIGEADLVFEHYAEGGVTRFSAVFYSHAPKRVGSIRSARLIDYELVPMYQGLLAFSGASLGVQKRIYGSEYVKRTLCRNEEDEAQRQDCEKASDEIAPPGLIPPSEFADRAFMGVLYGLPYYWRDETIPVPHNLFVNIDAVWRLAAERGSSGRPDLRGMTFLINVPSGDSGVTNVIDIRYRATRVRWEYDAESGLYRRFSDGKGNFDANTEQQVTAANVVVIYAGHYLTDIIESQSGDSVSYSMQITVWPEGDAVLFRDGRRYEGRWKRAARGDLISLHTQDGGWLYLKPGNTWFQLVKLPEQMNPDEEWVRME